MAPRTHRPLPDTGITLRDPAQPRRTTLWRSVFWGVLLGLGLSSSVFLPDWAPFDPKQAGARSMDASRAPTPADLDLGPHRSVPSPTPPWLRDVDPNAHCPAGWQALGEVRVTSYIVALEADYPASDPAEAPCGAAGIFASDFLFGTGLKMQGSGRALDGRMLGWRDGCVVEQDCPRTASGTCAQAGRTVAVDRLRIPLGTDLWIEGVGSRTAEDTGGAIEGLHVDVFAGEGLAALPNALPSEARVCVRPDAQPESSLRASTM